MLKEQIIELIYEIKQTDIQLQEYFNEHSDLGGIGMTSLEYIQLIVYMEERFNVEFDDVAFQEEFFKDINLIVEYVDSNRI